MLIDRYLPQFDVTEVHDVTVAAPADVTFAAIRRTNLRDPFVDALFAIREWPESIRRWMRGEARPAAPKAVTFADMATSDMGFMTLAEAPEDELVVGSVGRFWTRDYGWRRVPPREFVAFAEPGYAKLAVSFRVIGNGAHCRLRYEARTATTDERARTRFRRYWRLIRPGVAIVMWRALRLIKAEAERQYAPAASAVRVA